ncbi:hypothetical protein KJ866_02740 [Patescibacteria group bacterium]|nr:hypothetical protein [Patescibacteria group bacterium]MBU2219796.1 hypothetical protein [Patescibacteria group bacterium]MBU2264686.1 hypothetical protein [Patescibacteria group bacterium]
MVLFIEGLIFLALVATFIFMARFFLKEVIEEVCHCLVAEEEKKWFDVYYQQLSRKKIFIATKIVAWSLIIVGSIILPSSVFLATPEVLWLGLVVYVSGVLLIEVPIDRLKDRAFLRVLEEIDNKSPEELREFKAKLGLA